MTLTVKHLSDSLNGIIDGDESLLLTHPAKIEEATSGSISFLANMKYEKYLYDTNATAVLIPKDFQIKEKITATLIRVDDPYSSFVKVLHVFADQLHNDTGIHPTAVIHHTATVADDVYIGANVVISEGVEIGTKTKILANSSIGKFAKLGSNNLFYQNVSVYHFCEIGNNVILHSGCVIGSDGFGFAPKDDGSYSKIPQIGNVIIGNNVEVGANSSIDRATMGSTIIGNGVKVDNLVQIAHNVIIDENTVVAAQAGISGSTKIGKEVVIGGQAGFVGHISVANKVKINAKSGINKTVKEEGIFLSGNPAVKFKDDQRSKSIYRQLPKLEKRVSDLEKKQKSDET